jgi:hypothetical protein
VDGATYRAVVTDDDAVRAPVPIIRMDRDGWLGELADLVQHTIMNR